MFSFVWEKSAIHKEAIPGHLAAALLNSRGFLLPVLVGLPPINTDHFNKAVSYYERSNCGSVHSERQEDNQGVTFLCLDPFVLPIKKHGSLLCRHSNTLSTVTTRDPVCTWGNAWWDVVIRSPLSKLLVRNNVFLGRIDCKRKVRISLKTSKHSSSSQVCAWLRVLPVSCVLFVLELAFT